MIKKIILWTLFAGLVGVLVIGAVNRTQAKASEAQGLFETTDLNQQRYGSNDQAEKGGNRSAFTQTSADWSVIDAVVEFVTTDSLAVVTVNQSALDITGRAWAYIQESGFLVEPGDQLRISGFYEQDDHFEVVMLENLSNDQLVTVRDQIGRPVWAGKGRRGNP